MATTSESTNKSTTYRNFTHGVRPSDWDVSRLSWKVEMTKKEREGTNDEGKKVIYAEQWGIVPYYKYDDGKEDQLCIHYDVTPVHITNTEGEFGKERKIVMRIDRTRAIYKNVLLIRDDLKSSCSAFMMSHDCSKVLGELKVVVVDGEDTADVYYKDFIGPYIAGKATSVVEKAAKKFKDIFDKKWKSDILIVDPPDVSKAPSKWMSITKYPKRPYNDTPEAQAKFEISKVEGSKKVFIWVNEDFHRKFDHLIDPKMWRVGKKGGQYTTDYDMMTYRPQEKSNVPGQTTQRLEPYLAVNTHIKCARIVVSKKKIGEYSFTIDEDVLSALLMDLKPAQYQAREDKRLKDYEEEFGESSLNAMSRLRQMADGDMDADV